jgi:hypothetical protein
MTLSIIRQLRETYLSVYNNYIAKEDHSLEYLSWVVFLLEDLLSDISKVKTHVPYGFRVEVYSLLHQVREQKKNLVYSALTELLKANNSLVLASTLKIRRFQCLECGSIYLIQPGIPLYCSHCSLVPQDSSSPSLDTIQ